MKSRIVFSLIMMLFLSLTLVQAPAYIKFDGVDGESSNKDYDKWIVIESFGHSIHQSDIGIGATKKAGEVILDDIVLTKYVDKSSPKLMEAMTKGTKFPNVVMEITKNIGGNGTGEENKTYLKYELKNVLITSYSISGSNLPQDDIPTEEITFNYEKIKTTYTEYDKNTGRIKGMVEFIFDLIMSKRA